MQDRTSQFLTLDHLVFGTNDLDRGTALMMRKLGVEPGGGGKHPQMGTHNSLWRLGDSYLEVISIDPEAPAPGRARWFGLDTQEVRAELGHEPQLLTWVLRSDAIEQTIAASPLDPGPALRFTRDNLHWHLTVPDDGTPHHRGAYPAIIEWPEGVEPPFKSLPNTGLKLSRFAITGPPGLHKDLKKLGASGLYERHLTETRPQIDVTIEGVSGGEPAMFSSL